MEEVEVLVQRAQGLVDLNRYPAAIKELKKALSIDPEHFYGLALICGCFIDTRDKSEAMAYSKKLVSVYPHEALSHYYLAHAYDLNGKPEKAETEIREAISIEPNDADYLGFLGALYIDKKDWPTALEYINKGLEVDPENVLCLNHRTLILTKLGRKEEMRSAAQDTLAASPDNWYSHSNVGWSCLEAGDYNQARSYFLEALRINPNAGHARDGLKQVLKTQNPIFRWYQQYSFWMARKANRMQWGVVILFMVTRRAFVELAEKNPVFYIPVGLMILLIYTFWIIEPLGDLLLVSHPTGRHLLNEDEKRAGWITGAGIVLALVTATLGFAFDSESAYLLAVVFATIVIPLGSYFHQNAAERTLKTKILTGLTLAMAITAIPALLFFDSIGIFLFYLVSIAVFSFLSLWR